MDVGWMTSRAEVLDTSPLSCGFPAHAEPRPEVDDAIMSPEKACKVLQVTLGADWEMIEKSRRDIVQKSHPGKIGSVPPERRRALIEHARRANEAVLVLLGLRIQENACTSRLSEATAAATERPAGEGKCTSF